MNSRNPWVGMLLIVSVGGALGLGYNALQPRALPWIAEPKPVVALDSLSQSGSEPPGNQDQTDEQVSGNASPQVSKTTAPAQSNPPPAARTETTPGQNPAPVTATAMSDIPESEYPIEIHLAKTKELYDRGGLVILDAREPEEYGEGHIHGAQSAPGDVVAGDLEWLERMSQEPRPILVYCGGGDCELSINLGFELNRAGHRRVLVFKEGFPAWKDAGYPVDEGAAP